MSDRTAYTCVIQKQFREDLEEWVKLDRKIALNVLSSVNEVLRDLFTGRGKPEFLKYLPENVRSRRITQEDWLVYRVEGDLVDFLQCKYHY